jgi:D-glycero-D-manno-heptose 1,7-bisphosphate phosphatase
MAAGTSTGVLAVFLDRDGVINELTYNQERGIIDSPFKPEQFHLLPGVPEAIKKLKAMNYRIVLVSNQPGIAKGNFSEATFEAIRNKMNKDLSTHGASLDGEYYCFHHPEAKILQFKQDCDCRKPKPGLLLRAAKGMAIDLSQSWLVGDNLSDVKAGKNAGCRTILLGRMKCELCRLMDDENSRPDAISANLTEAAKFILNREVTNENLCRLS